MDTDNDISFILDKDNSNAFADHRASSPLSLYNLVSANCTMSYCRFLILETGSKMLPLAYALSFPQLARYLNTISHSARYMMIL